MQLLNQNEIKNISGGILSPEKPLAQSNVNDVITLLGAYNGFNVGSTLGSTLDYAVKGIQVGQPLGSTVGAVGGAITGGLLGSLLTKYVLPRVLNLIG